MALVDTEQAAVDIVDAARAVGLNASVESTPDGRADVVRIDVNGRPLVVEVTSGSTPSPSALGRRLDRDEPRAGTDPPVLRVLVADRLVAAARDTLRDHGWGWLDRRGHLHLAAPGLLVDTAVPAATVPQPRRGGSGGDPLGGRAGLEVVCQLLLSPERPASVRGLARELGRSPSTVSSILGLLRSRRLLDDAGHPVIPDLFWETADRWRPVAVDLAGVPSPDDAAAVEALQVGLHDLDASGWALADTLAAQAYGAPVAVPSAYPPDFYVPGEVALNRALRLLGVAASPAHRAATVTVSPVPAACDRRQLVGSPTAGWPVTRPLFVALDLARDPGRGREILDGWTPSEERLRVW